MREFFKKIYRLKIRVMFYFNLGWGDLAAPIAVVRDIAIVLTFAKLVLNISFGLLINIAICFFTFSIFILIGFILKFSGMSDYATKIGNSVNPELKKINKIAEHLGIKE